MSLLGISGRPGLEALAAEAPQERAAPPGQESPRARAAARFRESDELYRRGDYVGALRRLQQAQGLYPSPNVHFNLGQVYWKLGRHARALLAFRRFLREAPDDGAAARQEALAAVAALEREVGHVRVRGGVAGSRIWLDGEEVGTLPSGESFPADVGPHHVIVQRPTGAEISYRLELRARETKTIQEGASAAAPGPAVAVSAAPVAEPRSWIGLSLGTGFGWHPARRPDGRLQREPAAGFAGAGLGFAGIEVGRLVGARAALSLQARYQSVPRAGDPAPGEAGPDEAALAALLRGAYRVVAGDRLALFASAAVGVGSAFLLRVPRRAGEGTSGTVSGGPLVLGPGGGAQLRLGPRVDWELEARALGGLPRPAVAFELGTGLRLRF
jgi:hypothetical protein